MAVLWVLVGEDGVVVVDVWVAEHLQRFAKGLCTSAWEAEVDQRERFDARGLLWCRHLEEVFTEEVSGFCFEYLTL